MKTRYSDFQILGAGMFGQVYKAHDENLNITVAINVLKRRELTPDAAVRFQQEAKSAGRLQHPNFVRVMDFGIARSGQAYLVMEYVAGRTPSSIIGESKVLSLVEGWL